MNFIQNSCIRIPLIFKDEPWFQTIISELTRTAPDYTDQTKINIVKFFGEKDGNLLIPRFYPIEKLGHTKTIYLSDGEDVEFEFKTEWRNDLQKQGFEFITTNDKGVLQLLPGEGKTVISIGAISKIKKKSMIFVHKDSLVQQWKERFLQHTNLQEHCIGILKNDKIEEVLRKPIVIGTVQSMASAIKRIDNIEKILQEANFGVVIFDECHTTGGATEHYGKVCLHFPAKKVYGLSATPGRSDNNHDIIHMCCGDVYKPTGETNTMTPKIIILNFDHKAVAYHKQYIYWGIPDHEGKYKLKYPKFDISRYLQMLVSKKNDRYIPYLRKICQQVYNSDRNALFIADRIKILDRCATAIPSKSDVGFFMPRSGKERDNELQKRFVFSTPGSARDGTDKPAFDTLIMATPISNIEQAIGRICRFKAGKKQPVVFDLIDTGSPDLVKRAEWRKAFYKDKCWEVEEKTLG